MLIMATQTKNTTHTLDDYARAIYGEIYVTAAEVIFITLGRYLT